MRLSELQQLLSQFPADASIFNTVVGIRVEYGSVKAYIALNKPADEAVRAPNPVAERTARKEFQ